MGALKPFLFAYCDLNYYEKYGIALEKSAKAHGHKYQVICSGERLTHGAIGPEMIRHSHLRYHLLPEMLFKHGPVLMLDADSVIRKPIEIDDGYDLGLIVQNSDDYQRKINGGAVYMTPKLIPLATKLATRINFQHWFDDQISLYRECYQKEYKTLVFNDSLISWKGNPDAPIWTGKGKAKFRDDFLKEVGKWKNA